MTTSTREAFWQQHLFDWQGSGLSGAAFCLRQNLSYHQFTYWRRKLAEGSASKAVGFARATVMHVASMELTLTLPGGMAITGLHAGNVALLGAILEQL
jgi:hypothetical protein